MVVFAKQPMDSYELLCVSGRGALKSHQPSTAAPQAYRSQGATGESHGEQRAAGRDRRADVAREGGVQAADGPVSRGDRGHGRDPVRQDAELAPWLDLPLDLTAEFEADVDDLVRLIEATARREH